MAKTQEEKVKKLVNFAKNPSLSMQQEVEGIGESIAEIAGKSGEVKVTEVPAALTEKVKSISTAAEFVTNFLQSIKGDKGDPGDAGKTPQKNRDYFDGTTPVKGEDYYTPEEADDFLKRATPVKGVHYRDGEPGYTPQKNRDYFDGTTPVKGVDYFDGEPGKDGSPDTGLEIVSKLASLTGDARLHVSAIAGMKEMEQVIHQKIDGLGRPMVGSVSLLTQVNGAEVGKGSVINFIAGTGVTITGSNTDGHQTNITINGSGGSGSLVIGATVVTGATNGYALYNNNGVLGAIALTGTGTVTSVTSADGNATVANTTTTPVITIVSAPKLQTARTIAGTSFDGSANVSLANKFIVQGTADAGLTAAQFLGALSTGIVKNTTSTGVLSIAVAADFPTLNQSTTGSAATLTTPRTINGVNFDGSAPITVPAAAGTLTGTTLNASVVTSSLTSVGMLTSGTASAGFVLGGVTTTLGSDATGDLYYRNSSGVLTRLGIGSSTNVLTVSGGLPTWAAAGGGSSAWSSLTNPTANLSLATSTYTTAFSGTGGWSITNTTARVGGFAYPPSSLGVYGNHAYNDGSGTFGVYAQSNTLDLIYMGYDTTAGFGYVQSFSQGNSTEPLILNPIGGNVGIGGGGATPNALFQLDNPNALSTTYGSVNTLWIGDQAGTLNYKNGVGFGFHSGTVTVPTNFFGVNTATLDGTGPYLSYDFVWAARLHSQAYNTAPTETMRLTSAGNLGINDVAPAAKLSVVGGAQIGFSSGQAAPTNGLIVNGHVSIGSTNSTQLFSVGSSAGFAIGLGGVINTYSGVVTAGNLGVPAIYGYGRSTAQTAAVTSVATYTASGDGSYYVSANVNVTAAATASFQVTCSYTDETNTSRVAVLSFSSITGTFLNTITNVTGTGAYEGIPLHIRAKNGTTITIATTGTFTSVTYNVEGAITEID